MLLAKLFFEDIYDHYKKTNLVSYPKLEEWIGTEINKKSLWNLKDSAHLLLRNSFSNKLFHENVFDWTLGSIFHLGMKLKEDAYIIEVYQKEGDEFIDDRHIPEDVNLKDLLEERKIIINKAKDSAEEEMENLQYLFFRAMEQLKKIIIQNKQNGLLIRFLFEEEKLFDQVYGSGALKRLFDAMYTRGLRDAYLQAGKNYYDGGWYQEALLVLKKALKLDPQDKEVKKEHENVRNKLKAFE